MEYHPNSKLAFELKKTSKLQIDGESLQIPFELISKVIEGDRTIFDCTEWRLTPQFIAEFYYYIPRNYTLISSGSNYTRHIYNSPIYTLTIYDNTTGRQIFKKDIFEYVKGEMSTKNLSVKRRKRFEMEVYKIIDSCEKDINVSEIISNAIESSNI